MLFYVKTSEEVIPYDFVNIRIFNPPHRNGSSNRTFSEPFHQSFEPQAEIFPVTSKLTNETEAIIVQTGDAIGNKEILLEMTVKNDELINYQEVDHSRKKELISTKNKNIYMGI